MTVEEMLRIPSLSRLLVVAGHHGLQRTVSMVSVMDAPDIYNWMKGGEFLITSAYPVKDDLHYLSFLIRRLNDAAIAAFGVKLSRFIGYLPPKAIETANELGLPLISIPEEYAFTDIINPVLSRIVDQQAVNLMYSEQIHKDFLDLAVSGEDTEEILRVLHRNIGAPVAFINTCFKELSFSNGHSSLALSLNNMDPEHLTKDWLDSKDWFDGYDVYQVSSRNASFGYILTEKGVVYSACDNYVRMVVEYAGIILSLHLQSRISNQRIEEKYRDEFISDLLFHNIRSEDEIHNRSRLYGWDFRDGGCVIIADVDDFKCSYLQCVNNKGYENLGRALELVFDIVTRNILCEFENARYYKQSDHIVYIISLPENKRMEMQDKLDLAFVRIREQLTAIGQYTVTIGVGRYRANIKDIGASFNEAQTTVTLGSQLRLSNCVIHYEKMGIYRFLASAANSEDAGALCAQYIQPIVEYDTKYHSELLRTLRTLIHCGWNLKRAARELFIHYNSMKYRRSKLCKLIGSDLSDRDQQLNVEIAYKLYFISHKQPF